MNSRKLVDSCLESMAVSSGVEEKSRRGSHEARDQHGDDRDGLLQVDLINTVV